MKETNEDKTYSMGGGLPVRHQVLWPNKPRSFCKVDGDDDACHFGAFVNDELVSVASIFVQNDKARLGKFATLHRHQGQGIGTELISYIIHELTELDVEYFWCDARTSALGFYQRFGMIKKGAEFTKSSVQYNIMEARLTNYI